MDSNRSFTFPAGIVGLSFRGSEASTSPHSAGTNLHNCDDSCPPQQCLGTGRRHRRCCLLEQSTVVRNSQHATRVCPVLVFPWHGAASATRYHNGGAGLDWSLHSHRRLLRCVLQTAHDWPELVEVGRRRSDRPRISCLYRRHCSTASVTSHKPTITGHTKSLVRCSEGSSQKSRHSFARQI